MRSVQIITISTSILLSSTLLLPRLSAAASKQLTSADRPEHPFLTPITAHPLRTTAWTVFGSAMAMTVWGQHMRQNIGIRRSIQDGLLATILATITLFIIISAFGAPLDGLHLRTMLLALHVSLLTIYPVIQALGLPSLNDKGVAARYRLTTLLCEFSAQHPRDRLFIFPCVGALMSIWLGAVPLALDWDRPWQAWPLAPAIAATAGHALGAYASLLY